MDVETNLAGIDHSFCLIETMDTWIFQIVGGLVGLRLVGVGFEKLIEISKSHLFHKGWQCILGGNAVVMTAAS